MGWFEHAEVWIGVGFGVGKKNSNMILNLKIVYSRIAWNATWIGIRASKYWKLEALRHIFFGDKKNTWSYKKIEFSKIKCLEKNEIPNCIFEHFPKLFIELYICIIKKKTKIK